MQITIPTANPWVPLRILALGQDADDVVRADVFLLTDHQPRLLTGPGVSLAQSRPASVSLLDDLRSDHNMSWVPSSMWMSYLRVDTVAGQLRYDLAADVSSVGQPSAVAAGLSLGTAAGPVLPPVPSSAGLAARIAVVAGAASGLALVGLALARRSGHRGAAVWRW